MHTFVPRWTDDQPHDLPCFEDFHFHDALDVVAFAELDPLTTWRRWPEIWHLDDTGSFCCGSKGFTPDSVRRYADEPCHLLDCRETVLPTACPDRWVIVECRHPDWEPYGVDECDAEAFLRLRRALAGYSVTLLDVIVFDEDHRWWSLHELTSGTTQW
jgi:hypothetical protein